MALCAVMPLSAQDIVNLRMDRNQLGLRGYVATMDEDVLLRKDYFREDWPERKWFVKDLRNVLREEDGRIFSFDVEGRLQTVTYTHQGKQGKNTKCSYASNGLLTSFVGEGYKIMAKYYGNSADIDVMVETKDYDSRVNLAKDNLNTASYTYIYPYDFKCRQELSDDGLILKSNYFYLDSMPVRTCSYTYNHNNMLMSENIVDLSNGKEVTLVKYVYDNRNLLVKKTVNSTAREETYTYVNNEYGDCVSMTVERPYGTVVYTFDYVYDSNDNWTVRLQFEDGVFNNATLRTLTYHKEPKQSTVKENKKSGDAKSSKKEDKVKKEKSPKKDAKASDTKTESKSADKKAEKERIAAEKKAAKEAEARKKEAAKAEQERQKEIEKGLSKEERKALEQQRKEKAKAEKERIAAEKKAAKEAEKLAKQQAKEREKAEKERAKAEKKANKDK